MVYGPSLFASTAAATAAADWPTPSNQFDEQYFHEKLGKWQHGDPLEKSKMISQLYMLDRILYSYSSIFMCFAFLVSSAVVGYVYIQFII